MTQENVKEDLIREILENLAVDDNCCGHGG
jgi:hypothetical protein